ncbi:MAG: GNAT family N-acetyltransferase [Rhodospirillales bacterium]|nr:GNAT family N-acetyltransferase [Rhodospirillales bacterium]
MNKRRWHIRKAEHKDAGALLDLARELAAHHGDRAMADQQRLERLLDEKQKLCTVLVIEDETGNLLGFSAGHRTVEFQHGRQGFEIQNFMMRFQNRRRGHGRKLMKATAAEAVHQGAEKIKLGVMKDNWTARAFYMRLGFTEKNAGETGVRCTLEGKALQALLNDDEDVRYTGYSHQGTAYTGALIAVAYYKQETKR